MSYPSSLDNIASVSSGALITSAYQNQVTTAVNAIETVLGTNPAASFPTVAAAINVASVACKIALAQSCL